MAAEPRESPRLIQERSIELGFKCRLDDWRESWPRLQPKLDQMAAEHDWTRSCVRNREGVGFRQQFIDSPVDFRRRERRASVGVRPHDRREIIDGGRRQLPREPAHAGVGELRLSVMMGQMMDHERGYR